MSDLLENTLNLAEKMHNSANIEDLNAGFRNFLTRLGPFAHTIGMVHKTHVKERYLIDTTYPDSWMQYYLKNCYQNIDPVIENARHKFSPYDWNSINIRNNDQKKMMREFQDTGFKSGYVVPLPVSPSMLLLVGIASNDTEINFRDRAMLQIAVNHYHARYMQLINDSPQKEECSLSDRERECLLWSAHGKNTSEISSILRISENTVKYHLKNIMQKLGSHNRIQAVVKAINLGLIHP
ncbi:autoinducer binding domain-containing protein [Acetobacter fabarum]|uniref:helix-turn-helix transcriptional regulator n=1 Tax=Acetobacter fabarum TaxID=483199 RepID=UPI00312B7671